MGITNEQSSNRCHIIEMKKKAIIVHLITRFPEDQSIISKIKRLTRVVIGVKEHGLRTNACFKKGYARNKSDFNLFSIFITKSKINIAMIEKTWFVHKNI